MFFFRAALVFCDQDTNHLYSPTGQNVLMCRTYVYEVPSCIIKSLNLEERAYTIGTELKLLQRLLSCINSFLVV